MMAEEVRASSGGWNIDNGEAAQVPLREEGQRTDLQGEFLFTVSNKKNKKYMMKKNYLLAGFTTMMLASCSTGEKSAGSKVTLNDSQLKSTLDFTGQDGTVSKVGDYLFNDGSWGHLAGSFGARPIVLIFFSKTTSTADQGQGWTHGHNTSTRVAFFNSSTFPAAYAAAAPSIGQWYDTA